MSAASAPAAELCARGITKSYGGRKVLDAVSLTLGPGEVHAVLGPSGSGKTTLLRILNMLEAPDSGEVVFCGDRIELSRANRGLNDKQHASRLKMALVPQKPVAFRRSVFENAAFGLQVRRESDEEIDRRVRAALEPLGLLSLQEAQARRLSGGEQQRLAFARAAVLDVDFLLLDEFTANLDPRNVKILEEAARSYARDAGAGVLLVTHDLFQARRTADRVTLLVDGAVVESAPKAEFFESPRDPRTKAFVAGELAV